MSVTATEQRVPSSRESTNAAGWHCTKLGSLRKLPPRGDVPFSWINPLPLWRSRNDKLARLLGDPTNDIRREWVRRLGGPQQDFTVGDYADRSFDLRDRDGRQRRGRRLAAAGTTLLTPAKTRTAANEQRERTLASTRLVIESVFSTLKSKSGSSATSPAHRPGSPSGSPSAFSRSPSGCCSTRVTGRPARALAAYHGR